MRPIRIFAEHERHIKFIQDFLWSKYTLRLSKESYIDLGGIQNIGSAKVSFQMNSDEGGVNIVILDTQFTVLKDSKMLARLKKQYEIDFEHFTLPNNNDNGGLESLLYELVPYKFKDIKTCQISFGLHLSQYGYSLPSPSGLIYSYLDTVLDEGEDREMIAGEGRDYKNTKYWDIHKSASDPLAAFFNSHLT